VSRFHADGYAATTVAAVARDASVSAQTVYNTFGTKAALLKAAYDMTLAGDDDPVPLAERPEVRALYAETDASRFLRGYAALGRTVVERVGPLMLLIAAGADAGDPDLVALRDTTDSERLVGTSMVVAKVADLGALDPALTRDAARDRIWTLNSVQVWHLLTAGRGWSGDEYAAWIGDAMCAAILADDR
jgi:AcrR family transcriptional regulator